MAKQTINIGSSANAGDGDPLRTAFDKINNNFTELYARDLNTDAQTLTLVGNTLSISGGNNVSLDISPTGDLTGSVFADDSTLLVDAVAGKIVGDVENALINTRAIRSSDTGTGNLLLQGSSTSAGDGGTITIWGGSGFGTGNGGFVAIEAGSAAGSGTKGGINIGTSLTATGSVTIGLPLQSSIIVSNDDDSVTINGNVDFTGATVSGLSVSAAGFTYSELGGTSEIGVTADVFDFGDGKTIDMQNSTVLFTGSTVSGILSLNTDYITIGVGGSINMQGSDIGAAGAVSAASVSTLDLTTNTVRSEGDINISVNLTDSTTRNWAFTEGGDLRFPDGTAQSTAYTGSDNPFDQDLNTTDSPQFNRVGLTLGEINVATGRGFNLYTTPDGETVHNLNFTTGGDLIIGTLSIYDGTVATDTGNTLGLYSGANVAISSDGGNYEWNFDANGDLGFPGSAGTNYVIGESEGGLYISSSHDLVLVTDEGSTDKMFIFNTDGDLRLPGSMELQGNIRSENNIDIEINLSDSTLRRWTFGEDGDLTLPNGYAVNSGEAGVLSLGSDRLGVRLNSTDQSTLMVAKQSFNRTFDEDFTGHTFSILNTPNRVRVTFEANNGLYLKGLIERWVVLYENIGLGDPYSFEFDYSNIRLSLEPDLYDIVTNVVNVTQFDELIFDIEIDQDPIAVLAAAGKEPGELDQIALRYDYNNTVGFDIGRNKYGMSVDHQDIDIRAGRDIDLDATDDFRVRAGSTLNLHLERNEDQAPDEGIGINLWNNWNTALEDVKTWTFGFDGNLYLPDGSDLISTNDINITINNFDSTTYTWNFGNTGDLTAPGDITTGLLNVGGRFIQDCGDGTTSMRWINVEEGSDTTQILRVYTGDPKQDTEIERAQLLLNWSGNSNEYSGFTIKSFDNTDPNTPGEYDWQFQGDGTLRLPESSIGGGIGLIYSPTDSSIWLSGTNVDKSTDGNGVVLNGGQNDGTGRGGGISLFGGSSTGGTGGSIFIETGIGQGGADNGVIAIGTAYAKTITIGKASQSDNNRFFGNLIGNVENDDDITITVANNDSTTYAWNFGNTGDLTVPGDITFNGDRTISPIDTSTSSGSELTIQGGTSTSSFAMGGNVNIDGGAGQGAGAGGSVLINTGTNGGVLIGKSDGTGFDVQTYSRLHIHRGVVESYEAKQDATGVVEHDCDAGHLFYHTSPDANWTVNLTNLNSFSGMSTNIVIVIEQGGTPYYPNALQIDGAAQTIKWLGNVTPTPSGNKTEIATFTIFDSGSSYNVLGSYSTYG